MTINILFELTGIGKTENTRTKDSIHKIENCQKEIDLK